MIEVTDSNSKIIYFNSASKKTTRKKVAKDVLVKMGIYKDGFTSWEKVKKVFNLYTPLDKKDYDILDTLMPNKNMVRYYDLDTKQFKFGGILLKYTPGTDLVKPTILIRVGNLYVTLHLNDIILFIPPKLVKKPTVEIQREKVKLYIKNKLYRLFLKGKVEGEEVDKLYDLYNARPHDVHEEYEVHGVYEDTQIQ